MEKPYPLSRNKLKPSADPATSILSLESVAGREKIEQETCLYTETGNLLLEQRTSPWMGKPEQPSSNVDKSRIPNI